MWVLTRSPRVFHTLKLPKHQPDGPRFERPHWLLLPPVSRQPGHPVTRVPVSAGAVSPPQFPGLPSRSAVFQQQPESCSPPPGVALTCLGLQQPAQPQPVTIQVQEPVDVLGGMPGAAAGSAGRGMSVSPSASQIQMQHRTNLMAAFSYGHRPLSKQLSADSAETHR